MHLSFNPAIPFVGIHTEGVPLAKQKYICRRLLIIAWLVIVKYCKQLKRPYMGKSLNKLWYFHVEVKKKKE